MGIAGPSLGGGFALQTWFPYASLLPQDARFMYWAQLGFVAWAGVLAALAAGVSVILSSFVWKAQGTTHTFFKRTVVCYLVLLRGALVAMGRTLLVGFAAPSPSPLFANALLTAAFWYVHPHIQRMRLGCAHSHSPRILYSLRCLMLLLLLLFFVLAQRCRSRKPQHDPVGR